MKNNSELRKTEQSFWTQTHERPIRYRLPSSLNIGTANILRLLGPRVSSGSRVVEIGFAPGKILAYLGCRPNAIVSGVNYSENGLATAKTLFGHLGLTGDLRCEDVFSSSFPVQSFDFVYSLGFVEHFDNASAVVERHFQYLAPGGRALIAIPNYCGVYGKLRMFLDPGNLEIHNLKIMQQDALMARVRKLPVSHVSAYAFGRLNTSLLSFQRKLPRFASAVLRAAGNLIGRVQPVDNSALYPPLTLGFTPSPG